MQPELLISRDDCRRLRSTLQKALCTGLDISVIGGNTITFIVDLNLNFIKFGIGGLDFDLPFNRCRCRELIALLSPANLNRLEREDSEEMEDE